ncbi:MAG TPA: RNA polymerase sigma-70 factor [Chitinophagaceae bacterium]|nr:RNA polymerase sigma-70 factor [Chitinophagaceae bacterium]
MPLILPEDEKLLIQQVTAGNEEAFARLFNAYRDKLFAFIYRMTSSRELAEDLVQDVFLKIWMQREKLSGIDNFNAFLFRMSQNHAINHMRRMAKETLVLMQTQRQNDRSSPAVDEQVVFNHIQRSLDEIVANLPPRQKAVYQLGREQHLKQEEIAEQLSISVSTVKNHMTQALHTVREGLRKYHTDILLIGGILLISLFI